MSTITNPNRPIIKLTQEVPMSTTTAATLADPTVLEDVAPRSGWDFAVGSIHAPELRTWASDQFRLGEVLAVQLASIKVKKADAGRFVSEAIASLDGCSEPFLAGFLIAQVASVNGVSPRTVAGQVARRILDGAPDFRSTVPAFPAGPTTADEAAAYTVQQHLDKIEAAKEAQGNIQRAARASMKPAFLSPYESDELDQAMAVTEQFGRWNPDGGFMVGHCRTLDGEAEAYAAAAQRRYPIQLAQARSVVKRRLFDYAADKSLRLVGGKVSLFFDRTLGQGEWAPAGTEEIIFVSMPTNTRAYTQRGEQVWALHYLPPTYTDRSGNLRSAFQAGEKHGTYEDGLLGVVAVYHDLEHAQQAIRDLRRAITTIARSNERADQFLHEAREQQDHVAPDIEADPVL